MSYPFVDKTTWTLDNFLDSPEGLPREPLHFDLQVISASTLAAIASRVNTSDTDFHNLQARLKSALYESHGNVASTVDDLKGKWKKALEIRKDLLAFTIGTKASVPTIKGLIGPLVGPDYKPASMVKTADVLALTSALEAIRTPITADGTISDRVAKSDYTNEIVRLQQVVGDSVWETLETKLQSVIAMRDFWNMKTATFESRYAQYISSHSGFDVYAHTLQLTGGDLSPSDLKQRWVNDNKPTKPTLLHHGGTSMFDGMLTRIDHFGPNDGQWLQISAAPAFDEMDRDDFDPMSSVEPYASDTERYIEGEFWGKIRDPRGWLRMMVRINAARMEMADYWRLQDQSDADVQAMEALSKRIRNIVEKMLNLIIAGAEALQQVNYQPTISSINDRLFDIMDSLTCGEMAEMLPSCDELDTALDASILHEEPMTTGWSSPFKGW